MSSSRRYYLCEVNGKYIFTDWLKSFEIGKPEWNAKKQHYMCPLWLVSIDSNTTVYFVFTAETPTEAFRQATETVERIVAFDAEVKRKLEVGELPTDTETETETTAVYQPTLFDRQYYDALFNDMTHPDDLKYEEWRERITIRKRTLQGDETVDIYHLNVFAFSFYYRVVKAEYMKQPPRRPEDVVFYFTVFVSLVYDENKSVEFYVTYNYCQPLLRFFNFLRTGSISDADTFGLVSKLRQMAEKYLDTLKERRGDK